MKNLNKSDSKEYEVIHKELLDLKNDNSLNQNKICELQKLIEKKVMF